MAGDALGLTPLVYLVAGVFLVLAIATYVEGSSLHPERGGASTLARYAFDELWSFIAGWAILLDYLIVMAIAAVAITPYLTPFWNGFDEGLVEIVIGGVALAFVALQNVRGLSADLLRVVLRLSLLSIGLLIVVSGIAFAQFFDLDAITDGIELGTSPSWGAVIFATVIASVAIIGVEAASGLAGEIRVGRRGLRRVVMACAGVALILLVVVSAAAVMAQPVVDGATPLGSVYVEAPVLGIVSDFEPTWLMDASRYVVAFTAAGMLLVTMNGQMLGLSRLSYSLATNRQIPSSVGRLNRRRGTPYIAISSGRSAGLRARAAPRPRLPGRHLRLRGDAHGLARPPVGDRPALSRARAQQSLPGAPLGPGRRRQHSSARRAGRRALDRGLGQRDRPARGRARGGQHLDGARGADVRGLSPQRGPGGDQALHDSPRGAPGANRGGVRQHPRAHLRREPR